MVPDPLTDGSAAIQGSESTERLESAKLWC